MENDDGEGGGGSAAPFTRYRDASETTRIKIDDGEGGGATAAALTKERAASTPRIACHDGEGGGTAAARERAASSPERTMSDDGDGGGGGGSAAASPGALQETGGGETRRKMIRNDDHLPREPAVASDLPEKPMPSLATGSTLDEFLEVDNNARIMPMPSPHEMPMTSLATGSTLVGFLEVDQNTRVMPMPSPHGFDLGTVPFHLPKRALTSNPAAQVKEIWAENAKDAFEEIKTITGSEGGTLLVALDTEFCKQDDGANDPRGGAPTSVETHYLQACRNVNEGDLIQVGIAFPKEKIFQFNLFLDQSARDPESKTLRFLTDVAKLNLNDHRDKGLPLSHFFRLMASSGLLANPKLLWITYQGYCDFGYLIRGIENVSVLPQRRAEFVGTVQYYFPKMCDIKILHDSGICCKPPPPPPRPKGTGGLTALADGLGVDRVGIAHGAGSDAHLTLKCYESMALSSPTAAARVSQFGNRMFGVAEASPMDLGDSHSVEIEVCSLGNEAAMFSQLFSSSQPLIVSVEVEFASGGDLSCYPLSYAQLRTDAALSGSVQICFGVSDVMSGCLLFGRIWRFKVGYGVHQIEPSEFAKLLMEAEIVLNPSVTWCSSSSLAYAYLVKILSGSKCLPMRLPGYFALSAAYFPNLTVLNVWLTERRASGRALIALRHFQTLLRERRDAPVGMCDLSD